MIQNGRRLLIVDDKVKLCQSLTRNFEPLGYECHIAVSSREAIKIATSVDLDIAIVDVRIGEEDGVELLASFKQLNPQLPVIMLTAYAEISSAVRSVKIGAYDYVQKPVKFEKLKEIVNNAIRLSELSAENLQLRDRIGRLTGTFITEDPKLIRVLEKAKKLADTDLPVLLLGESGTGKELMAEFVHAHSPSSSKEMVKVNCSAFTESLLNSELFGYEKGAFTGANRSYEGVFEQADKSTLFFDEIGDMPLSIQTKILRTLQDNRVRRVGGHGERSVDVRIISATNRPLSTMVKEGIFREDLYYRLNAVSLELPPLRNRKGDIPLLVGHLMSQFCQSKTAELPTLEEEVWRLLVTYDWPGNVRELRNVIHYASAMADGDVIQIDDLPPAFMAEVSQEDTKSRPSQNIRDTVERELIVTALGRFKGNKSRTADYLRMTRKTLYRKIDKYDIG